ncbi:hypothetical protein B0H13DRAFT_1972229 [Mycena leptocephala]|nr:hypothetical protein B0H13DRAFT_1972229 [Mycena leptocephala]
MMSRPNAQPGPTPKYLKILLAEVGKLRDEKRSLEYEPGTNIFKFYTGHGWRPQIEGSPPTEVPAPPPAPAPGGWRTVQAPDVPKRRQAQKQLQQQGYQQPGQHGQQIVLRGSHAPAPALPTAPAPWKEATKPKQDESNPPAWAQWRPNPLLAPGAPAGPSVPLMSPPRDGLLGPEPPPPKAR